jgi:hypothetical protein
MADIIARSFDPPLPWLDMGKPSDALLALLRTAYAVDTSKALMVGDTYAPPAAAPTALCADPDAWLLVPCQTSAHTVAHSTPHVGCVALLDR